MIKIKLQPCWHFIFSKYSGKNLMSNFFVLFNLTPEYEI